MESVENGEFDLESDNFDHEIGAPHAGRDLVQAALADARAMAGRRDDATGQRRHLDGLDPRVRRRRQRNRAANTRTTDWSGPRGDDRDPQSAKSVLSALFTERGWHRPVAEARIFADWSGLVGTEIAAHCTPAVLHDGELKVSAQSSAWATQVRLLGPTLLARLAGQLGAGVVTSLVVTGPSGPSWKHGLRSVHGARGPRDTYG